MKNLKYIVLLILFSLPVQAKENVSVFFSNGPDYFYTREIFKWISTISDSLNYNQFNFNYYFLPQLPDSLTDTDSVKNCFWEIHDSKYIITCGYPALNSILKEKEKFREISRTPVISVGINRLEYLMLEEKIDKFQVTGTYEAFNLNDLIYTLINIHNETREIFLIYEAPDKVDCKSVLENEINILHERQGKDDQNVFPDIKLVDIKENQKFENYLKIFNKQQKKIIVNIGKLFAERHKPRNETKIFRWLNNTFLGIPLIIYNTSGVEYKPNCTLYTGQISYDVKKHASDALKCLTDFYQGKTSDDIAFRVITSSILKTNISKISKTDPEYDKRFVNSDILNENKTSDSFTSSSDIDYSNILFIPLTTLIILFGIIIFILAHNRRKKDIFTQFLARALMLEKILDIMQDFVLITDPEYSIIYKNKTFKRLLKNQPETYSEFIDEFSSLSKEKSGNKTFSCKINNSTEVFQLYKIKVNFSDILLSIASVYSKAYSSMILNDKAVRSYFKHNESFIVNFALNRSESFKYSKEYESLKAEKNSQLAKNIFRQSVQENTYQRKSLKDFIENLSSIISTFTKASSIAFYLYDEKRKILNYEAGYATTHNQRNYRFANGEGTVGECFKLNKSVKYSGIYDKDINSNMLISATGITEPAEIYLFPINSFDSKIIGVVELLFHEEADKEKIDFFDQELTSISRQILLFKLINKDLNYLNH